MFAFVYYFSLVVLTVFVTLYFFGLVMGDGGKLLDEKRWLIEVDASAFALLFMSVIAQVSLVIVNPLAAGEEQIDLLSHRTFIYWVWGVEVVAVIVVCVSNYAYRKYEKNHKS